MTEGAQVHWQTGQGDRERRGGEDGQGLGQRDAEGELGGRVEKERGETGREEETSWVTKDSLLGEAVTEREAGSGVEEGRSWLGDVVAGLKEAVVWQERSEVEPDDVGEEVIGSACSRF